MGTYDTRGGSPRHDPSADQWEEEPDEEEEQRDALAAKDARIAELEALLRRAVETDDLDRGETYADAWYADAERTLRGEGG